LDGKRKLGNFRNDFVGYPTDLLKEELSRNYILGSPGTGLKFLDVGGKDGDLTYLLGIKNNLEFDAELYSRNKKQFQEKFEYFGMDLNPVEGKNLLRGDICSNRFLETHDAHLQNFDVIYSNNVFEHLKKPWIAAKNLTKMLKEGGLIITIVPFSQRYHEDPQDYFRYTHKGVISLFEEYGTYSVLESGYDIAGRRNNWQGGGEHNDIVPIDNFGAWRETWFTVNVMRKLYQ